MTSPSCPYCEGTAKLTTGSILFPHRPDLSTHQFWRCSPCSAYVGCHPYTTKPLGTLADEQTRQARAAAHRAFDPLWQSGKMTRSKAYSMLREATGVAHIGESTAEQCKLVHEFVWGLEPGESVLEP